MKKKLLYRICATTLSVMTALMCLNGCENGDDPDTGDLDNYFDNHPYVSDPRNNNTPTDVVISPENVTVTFVGQEIVFKASGGTSPYTWDIANNIAGSITSYSGDQGTYRAAEVTDNSVIVYDRRGHAAVATLTAQGSSDLIATASPDTLETDGAKSICRAAGGAPPYAWTLGSAALGTLNQFSGDEVIYTRIHSGDNTVQVEDSVGNRFSLLIQQP